MKKVFASIIFCIFPALLFAQGEDWVARYNGSGNGMDRVFAMALDSAGNIYITGIIDNGINNDYATVKYNADGVEQWVAIYDGAGDSDDRAVDICVDTSGNVYVTGFSYEGTKRNGVTIKYNSDGVEQWISIYEHSQSSAIAVDSLGNVHTFGEIYGNGEGVTQSDYLTVKYDSNGNKLWEATYDGPGDWHDWGQDITVDSSGNVYVTGGSNGGATGIDIATIKYDSSGTQDWEARFSGPGAQWDWGQKIALDSSGDVYVIGTYNEEEDGCEAYATLKYRNADGHQLWAQIYESGLVYNTSRDMVVDSQGNVYVSGTIYDDPNSEENGDISLVKYDTNGNQLWNEIYDGPENKWDTSGDIALGPDGSVYVTGNSKKDNFDYVTIKYDSSWNKEWDVFYNGPGNGHDTGSEIVVDPSGSVYVSGWSIGDTTGDDYCTIKYSHPLEIMEAEAIKEAISDLPDEAFSKPADNRRKNLMKWLDEVIEQIQKKNFQKAIQRLENILKKMDGYFGGNLKNDWITDQAAQEEIYPMVLSLINSLESLQ